MAELARMWPYWRDKKGLKEALEDYFPEVLAQDPRLRAALVQIESAELLIDKIMSDRAEQEGTEDE